ncbi:hypothetical protein LTR53_013548 [Teratosphaeriaceae sp. CCFEE 6253]|nr:hypothetical protein LTR53_013548 [Teratosphaeriaceae sp. CCFEE 6253]
MAATGLRVQIGTSPLETRSPATPISHYTSSRRSPEEGGRDLRIGAGLPGTGSTGRESITPSAVTLAAHPQTIQGSDETLGVGDRDHAISPPMYGSHARAIQRDAPSHAFGVCINSLATPPSFRQGTGDGTACYGLGRMRLILSSSGADRHDVDILPASRYITAVEDGQRAPLLHQPNPTLSS